MISMADLTRKLETSIGDPGAATKEGVEAAVRAHMTFLLEHYADLDVEAKEYADTAIREMVDQARPRIATMGESAEKRTLKRLLARMVGEHFSVAGILAGLDREGPEMEPYMSAAESSTVTILGETADVMFDATESGPRGEHKLVIAALLGSVIEDLLVALKLARHGLANQGIAVLRTADEKIDLIALFTEQAEHVQVWLHAPYKERWKKLSPKAVRRLLGGPTKDPAYDYFCAAGGHPTLLGMQNRSAIRAGGAERGDREIRLFVGGERLPWAIVPLYMAILTNASLALLVAIQWCELYAKHEENRERVARAEALYDQYVEAHALGMLRKMGVDVADLQTLRETARNRVARKHQGGDGGGGAMPAPKDEEGA